MPLYELFCIASHNPTSPANLRQLVSSVSSVIHNNGGVVRDLKSLGKGVTLPMKFRANQAYHTHGDQFLLTFDTNPIILNRVKETLRADPLVVRWTVLKKGSAIKDLIPDAQPPSMRFRSLNDL